MTNTYNVELTDTFGGDANYSWVKRATVTMPDLTHYGYDGSSNYAKANKVYQRELMKAAKVAVGLTGIRGRVENYSDSITFRPYGLLQVMFVSWRDA
jgi:hypothetical protein